MRVAVGSDSGVWVGGGGVSVGGEAVAVIVIVDEGGAGVWVGGEAVVVGETGVCVDGTGVAVGSTSTQQVVTAKTIITVTIMRIRCRLAVSLVERHTVRLRLA